jgi:hypothetical protein
MNKTILQTLTVGKIKKLFFLNSYKSVGDGKILFINLSAIKSILKSCIVHYETKIVFISVIVPVMLYGCEIWSFV